MPVRHAMTRMSPLHLVAAGLTAALMAGCAATVPAGRECGRPAAAND